MHIHISTCVFLLFFFCISFHGFGRTHIALPQTNGALSGREPCFSRALLQKRPDICVRINSGNNKQTLGVELCVDVCVCVYVRLSIRVRVSVLVWVCVCICVSYA